MTKALMTIHGFLTDTKDFGRLYDYVDFYDEVCPYKVPGHNDKVDFSLFTLESVTTSLLQCFDSLQKKYDTVDVVGFSMGGALATYLCAVRPVNRAVFVAPANKFFNWTSVIAAIKFYIRYLHNHRLLRDHNNDESLGNYLENNIVSADIAIKRTFKNVDLHTFSVFSNLMDMTNEQLETTKCVNTPSMLLWGELDEMVPKTSVEFVKNHFSNLKVEIVPDVGHAMLYTNKDNVLINKIVSFLSDGQVVPSVPFQNKIDIKKILNLSKNQEKFK